MTPSAKRVDRRRKHPALWRWLPLLLLFIFASRAAEARDYIVDTRNSAASDENDGTASKPLKTISAAAAKVQAGDHVIIHGGDYRETVIITASGTEEKPIVFEAAPNETPVIKGSELVSDWQKQEGAVWKAPLTDFSPQNADGENPGFWNTRDVRQIFARDGALLEARRLRRVVTKEEIQAGTFFCDIKEESLLVWLPDSSSPRDHPLEVSVRALWLHVRGSHVVVRGLQMRHASTTALANWPACSLSGDFITLEDCLLSWGDFAGLSMAGKSNRVLRCTVACNGNSGSGGTGENHLIEGCRFIYNNVDRYDIGWHAGGAKLIPTFQRSIIRRNEFAYNLGPGLLLDDRCNDNVIEGNFAHDNEGPGIMVEVSRGNLVMNNISAANRNLLSGPYRSPDGSTKVIRESEMRVAPSRLFRPYHAGDGRGIYISSSPSTKVLHNTAYQNEGEGICVEGPLRSTMETKDELVMNNISVFNHGSQLTIQHSGKSEGARVISDYNLLFSVGAVFARTGWDGISAFDLPTWQKASGQDEHSLDADPRFALATMSDFRLLKDSAALAAGGRRLEVDHDFLEQPRAKERPSIGAYEAPAMILPQPIKIR